MSIRPFGIKEDVALSDDCCLYCRVSLAKGSTCILDLLTGRVFCTPVCYVSYLLNLGEITSMVVTTRKRCKFCHNKLRKGVNVLVDPTLSCYCDFMCYYYQLLKVGELYA